MRRGRMASEGDLVEGKRDMLEVLKTQNRYRRFACPQPSQTLADLWPSQRRPFTRDLRGMQGVQQRLFLRVR